MIDRLHIQAGEIVAQRMFDVAYAIDLRLLEQLWARQTRSRSRRSGFSSTPPKAVAFDVPPVLLELEPVELTFRDVATSFGATARFYDFGVVCLALRLPISDCSWSAFSQSIEDVDRAIGPSSPTTVWTDLLARIQNVIASAFTRPSVSNVQEDYLYGIVRQFSQSVRVDELKSGATLIPLLSGETRQLSEGATRDLLRHQYSYYEDDLVVLTWDRAFVYDPRGDTDVADVIDVANAQLLEMRYYDELLDDELPRMYDLVEQNQRMIFTAAPRRFAQLARKLYGLVAEVTELKEKVDNALQVTEDVYLARIYSAALDLFRVANVNRAVDRKLDIIRDTYTALFNESSGRRAELLEVTIVLLIALEIVLALLGSV